MKASSNLLEIDVRIDKKEAIKLRYNHLKGILGFYDEKDRRRNIPFLLQHIPGSKEEIEVIQNPDNVYFGLCEHFKIIVYDSFYQDLVTKGSCGGRFYNSGKVIIEVK